MVTRGGGPDEKVLTLFSDPPDLLHLHPAEVTTAAIGRRRTPSL